MCLFFHKWATVAFEDYSDSLNETNYANYQKCLKCGKRRFYLERNANRNASRLKIAASAWINYNYIYVSRNGLVIDDDYVKVSQEQFSGDRYNYMPINNLDEALKAISNDEKYRKVKNHHMVAAAMEELKTVIKMHENIDNEG